MFLKKGEFMHPYVTVILLTVAAILLLVTWILYENRKQKKRMLRKIQRIYGKVPEREYAAGDLKNISHYFLRKRGTISGLMTLPGMTLIWTEFIC